MPADNQRNSLDLRIHRIAVDEDFGHYRVPAGWQPAVDFDPKCQILLRTRDAAERNLPVAIEHDVAAFGVRR